MADHIGFLIGSESVDLTVAPADAEDWQNEYYIPKSLYEPIFSADGTVNPGNAWASYVYRTVDTYKPWVKLWHVWNEPDWVADWHVTQTWDTEPPKAADLPGSTDRYLTIYECCASRRRPRARQIRRRGSPRGASDTPRSSRRSCATPTTPTAGRSRQITRRRAAPTSTSSIFTITRSSARRARMRPSTISSHRRTRSPRRSPTPARKVQRWNVSENGAPLAPTPEYPEVGSPEYARNYLIKMMTMAQAHGIGGVDWFILSNGEDGSDDVFAHMGLYNDIGALASVDRGDQDRPRQGVHHPERGALRRVLR